MTAAAIAEVIARPPFTWGADLAGLLLLTVYHLALWRVYRRAPERTYRGRSDRLREAWVQSVRAGNKDILAVQTLRNWIMSATLFASTSMLIGLGVLNVAFNGVDLDGISRTLSLAPTTPTLVRLKLLLIAAIFFGCFMHFALALRYYNHCGFMINLPANHYRGGELPVIAATLNRAGGHYNQGTRGYLLAAPFLLWLIGPDWFLGGVILALWLFWRFDYRNDDAPARPRNKPAARK